MKNYFHFCNLCGVGNFVELDEDGVHYRCQTCGAPNAHYPEYKPMIVWD